MGVSALPAGAGPQCPVAQRGRPGRPRAGRVLSAREQALSLRTGEGVGGRGQRPREARPRVLCSRLSCYMAPATRVAVDSLFFILLGTQLLGPSRVLIILENS